MVHSCCTCPNADQEKLARQWQCLFASFARLARSFGSLLPISTLTLFVWHFEHAEETPAQKMASAAVWHYLLAYLNKKETTLVTENPMRNHQRYANANENLDSGAGITQRR